MSSPRASETQSDSCTVPHRSIWWPGSLDFHDTQKKGEHMVGQVLVCPNNFQTNQRVLFIVVVIDGVMVSVVVSHHFRVVECGSFLGPSVIHPFSLCLLATAEVGPICRH